MIEWLSWEKESFDRAKKENRAIFISLGSENLGLQNRMIDEICSDELSLKVLQESYICIKVDMYERVDVHKYCQKIYQLLNKKMASSPISIFCTPQNKPIFGGTYISVESDEGSIEGMGFREISTLIANKINSHDETLYQNADEIESFMQKSDTPTQATTLTADIYKNFLHQAKVNYEVKFSGFSKAPKFPQTSTIKALIYIDGIYKDNSAKAMVIDTLKAMSKGGFYNEKEGFFYRYSLDDSWSKPSVDKLLSDNALLCDVYMDAYNAYGDESFLIVATNIANYWLENLGKESRDMQTSSISMMISSLFKLSALDKSYRKKAIVSIELLLKDIYVDSTLYHSSKLHVEAFLDDYANLSSALMDAYLISGDEFYLIDAQRFTNLALEKFYKNGHWIFSENEPIVDADIYDATCRSPISVMVDVMLSLYESLDDEKYKHFAFKTMEYNSFKISREPIYSPLMLQSILRYKLFLK